MKADVIEAKLNQLRAGPDVVEWPERIKLVNSLLGRRSASRPLDAHTAELVRLLAADSKWEVRMEVATHLHRLGDSDFAELAAILGTDDNAFVRSATGRELARRRKGHVGNSKRVRGLSRIEDDLQKLERRHGSEASNMAAEIAGKLYEGLVGATVHEMRGVVSAMKLDLELLSAGSHGIPLVVRIGPRLFESVAYLERLLDDIKEYTRAPAHELTTESLANMCDDALRMVRSELKSSGRDAACIAVDCSIAPDVLVRVARMPVVLALRNLIKNAHDAFMIDETRFEAGTVRITAEPGDDGIRLAISNTGPGLTAEELQNIRQFIPGRSSKGRLGTGFGLPIARRNIRANGGDLRIESSPGDGTRVTVWLPLNGGRDA